MTNIYIIWNNYLYGDSITLFLYVTTFNYSAVNQHLNINYCLSVKFKCLL